MNQNNSTYRSLDSQPIENTWKEYNANRTTDVRNYIIEKFLPLVTFAAERLKKRLPNTVEIGDLHSAGTFGLIEAIDGYDIGRKVKFETYSAPRIRGSMLDELRRLDWVPRRVREQTKIRESTEEREYNNAEIPLEEIEVGNTVNNYATIKIHSLTSPKKDYDGEVMQIEDTRTTNLLQDVYSRNIKDTILTGLPRDERLILLLRYYEDLEFKDIIATLGSSRSSVYVKHLSILDRLKKTTHLERLLK
jgi:RNA polymerase sigma factor for flagellar operon FliA